jgi:uncharacterized tellurite resistance protein B-like protein
VIAAIKLFFDKNLHLDKATEKEDGKHRIEMASAALLFELLKIDEHIDKREMEILAIVLRDTFGLEEDSLRELIDLAEIEAQQATSLYEFTSLINAEYSYEERVQLIENLWKLAYADASLDKYEEHLIRKVSDLIYVRHSDFIRTKLLVKNGATG